MKLMIKLFHTKIDFSEIHRYVQDVEIVTGLRDRAMGRNPEEAARLDEILVVMQKVLQRLTEKL